MRNLSDKVVVITGGNSGIGKAAAQLFAKEGAQVVITGRRQDALDSVVKEIGSNTIGICGDVADISHHNAVADEVQRKFGRLDVYMANAGYIHLTSTDAVSVEEYDRHFAINTRGVFFGVQAIAPLLGAGSNIILTSSMAATKVLDNHAVYAGSKAAIAAFARNWALEFKAQGIRVNVLSPGPIETPSLSKLGVAETEQPRFLEMMAGMIPAGRLGRAEEVAEAALFLASASGSFVNGVELIVDGGMALT